MSISEASVPNNAMRNVRLVRTTWLRRGLPAALSTVLLVVTAVYAQTDPLPSWNDGAAKQGIINFVRTTTDSASQKFVPPEERVATFDQDGTLWVEHPMYSQVVYCLERVPRW